MKSKTQQVLETLKVKREVPLGDDFFIPNNTGNLSYGRVVQTPTLDTQPASKAYVDSQVSSGVGVTTGAVPPSSTPSSIGALYIDTSTNILYVAMGTSSSSDWKAVLTE